MPGSRTLAIALLAMIGTIVAACSPVPVMMHSHGGAHSHTTMHVHASPGVVDGTCDCDDNPHTDGTCGCDNAIVDGTCDCEDNPHSDGSCGCADGAHEDGSCHCDG